MNRLAQEPSLYLRQHAHNPVEWRPWGKEAQEEAGGRDLPLFISIGYSSCHWCHVMERESFEDPEIAALLNEHFIPVKVDREEHPELDAIYMQACLLIHGHGGWPLNVFAYPDGTPFFAGTYFPPRTRAGQLGFRELLLRIHELWLRERDALRQDAQRLKEVLSRIATPSSRGEGGTLSWKSLEEASLKRFDPLWGGQRGAPKFPPHEALHTWITLLSHGIGSGHVRHALRLTLDRMNFSGLRDQLSGGYHRYCVDEGWRIPHFEKMLYDQAAFLHHLAGAYTILRDPLDLFCLGELFRELVQDWKTPEGWFASSFDADDPGGEGFYYTFTPGEIFAHLGKEEGEKVCLWFQIEEEGTLEGRSTLYPLGRPDDPVRTLAITGREPFLPWFQEVLKRLRALRAQRPKPQRDDKGIVTQNAYLLLGLLELLRTPLASQAREEAHALAALLFRCAGETPLPRVLYREGFRGVAGIGEYAYVGSALVASGLVFSEPSHLERARFLLDTALREYFASGRWSFPARDLPWGALPGFWDGEVPTPLGVLYGLLSVFSLFFPERYEEPREALYEHLAPLSEEYPEYTLGVQRHLLRSKELLSLLVLPYSDPGTLLPYLPREVLPVTLKIRAWLEEERSPFFADKPKGEGQAYLCTVRACEPPQDPSRLLLYLKERFPAIQGEP